jgi:YidC/Oxa1 family membrane protein insertase
VVKHNLFTTFKKYSILIFALLILGGCTNTATPIDSSSTGFFDSYFVYPISFLIKEIAWLFHDSYGIAIVLITIAIRLLLLPFAIKQAKNGKVMKEKMIIMKPEMELIQRKYKTDKSVETQVKMQQELNTLYKKHNYSPINTVMGCLPLLAQAPILIALYYAIMRTPEIASTPFLWFNLGEMDLLLVAITVAIYYIQAKVSLINMQEPQRKQMALMSFISPIMIGIMSFNAPAALALYWFVGGTFVVIQTIMIKRYVN